MSPNNPLYLCAPALDPEELETFRAAMKLVAYDGQRVELTAEDRARAHLLVVDEDHAQGARVLLESLPGQVKLVFANQPRADRNLIAISKPVNISVLKTVLERLLAKMSEQLARTNAESSPPPESVAPTADQGSDETLFHILLRAKTEGSVLRIACEGCADIFVDGINRSLATAAPLESVRNLYDSPPGNWRVDELATSDFAVLSSGLNIATLHNVLWSAGVRCSHGRLLPGHRTDRPVRLRAWPNFTRGDFHPAHLKIAALLAREPLALDAVPERAGVSREDAVNFYNAAYAVDLIDTGDEPQAPSNRAASGSDAERRSLLARIAQRLSLRK